MAKPPDKTRVRAGAVSIPLYRHAKGWRWAWRDPATGQWRYGTRRDRTEALAEAHRQAVALGSELGDLERAIQDPDTAILIRRFLRMEPTHQDLDRLAEQQAAEVHPFSAVADEFLAAKEAARGLSRRNIRTLQTHLDGMKARWAARPIHEITPADIEAWIHQGDPAPRTRKNRRGAAVTLWRWARSREKLPDQKTAAERTEQPIVPRGVPTTWTPAELAAMWAVCPESHRPWLALSALAGLRGEETYQEDPLSGKDVVRWRDLAGGILTIRPEVAKTGVRRVIPICPALAAFLAQERVRRAAEGDDTPICPGRPPSRDLPVINRAVTTILGNAVGGWKVNALRHSFISYRAVQVGLARAALEAGNSEAEARRSYHDAMTEADAAAWFGFGTPSEPGPLSIVGDDEKIVAIR